jgi:phosphatidylglycerol:prolipoprotein diacylglycerol transferase
MWPIIVDFGAFKIYSFGTFIVLAFLVAAFYVRRRASRTLGLDKEKVFNVCFWLLFLGLAGARLVYALVHYGEFTAKPMSVFAIWQGGLTWYGGLIAGLLWLAWYLPRHPDLKGFAFLDVLALGACLAVFVGRWASFLSGENYGKPAPGLPWAVTFPVVEGSQARPLGVALHPTQLYHSLHGLILFALLLLYQRRRPFEGRTAGLFLALYAVGTVVIEVWRGDDEARGMLVEGYVSTSQFLSVPVFFVGLAIFLIRKPPEHAYAR